MSLRNLPQIEQQNDGEVEDQFVVDEGEDEEGQPLEKRLNMGGEDCSMVLSERQPVEEQQPRQQDLFQSETRDKFLADIDAIQVKLEAKRARDEQVLAEFKSRMSKMVEDYVDNMSSHLGGIQQTITARLNEVYMDAQANLDRIIAHEQDLAHFKQIVGGFISTIP